MTAASLVADFLQMTSVLKGTLYDAEAAFKGKHLRLGSYHSVVELAHLQAVSLFEAFIEDLFFECMLGTSGLRDVQSHLPLATRADVELAIFAEGRRRQKYLSWLPYDDTLERAGAYLVGAQPFARLQYRLTEIHAIRDAVIIRNAVAHSSGHALSQLLELARSRSYQISRPADFLLSTRGGPSEALIGLSMLELIAMGLADPSEAAADARLNPEREFDPRGKVPAGNFKCASCGHLKRAAYGDRLGNCASCSQPALCSTCGNDSTSPSRWRRQF
ncbi:MAG: hypothetical protein AB7I38_19095 [Dehalococcoidia bacterium]